jgi:transposase-like protein
MKEEILKELALLKQQYPKEAHGRSYPLLFKNRIIELLREGVDVGELNRATDVPPRTLRGWQQSMAEKNFKRLHITRSPTPLRILLSEKVWLEIDDDKVTPALLQKIRAMV